MGIDPWIMVALVANIAGYAVYLRALRRDLVEPNRASWLIWSIGTGVEAATYAAVNPRALQTIVLLVSALACILVMLGIWRRSAWASPSRSETACIVASLGALVLWLGFRDAFWAHMLVVVAVPVSFWPTWVAARADPQRERSPAWGLWTIGDLATLLVALGVAHGRSVGELAYPIVELASHAAVWGLVLWGTRRRGARALTATAIAERFRVGSNHLGKAVFANTAITEGARLFPFTGPRLRAARVPQQLLGNSDRYVQVTPDEYMGPSGRIDDLVNHSCDPNAGLRFADDGVWLVALRDIAAGEEVAWDYSTTLSESNWHMLCQCRAPECRRVIGNFAGLPPERQEWFRAKGVVAPYLRRRDDTTSPDALPSVAVGAGKASIGF
ncbi:MULTISPECIES: SET domain-containing protein [unclassified Sphingomonas]|uniref:SET domain-containing protein n=1 Tax=unclassified Sphingomonas TaxID=196159 RepID=UPI0009E965F8|nr:MULTISPECIES: SET domain-containing protein [unclassified Sphingomonas]